MTTSYVARLRSGFAVEVDTEDGLIDAEDAAQRCAVLLARHGSATTVEAVYRGRMLARASRVGRSACGCRGIPLHTRGTNDCMQTATLERFAALVGQGVSPSLAGDIASGRVAIGEA
jgi:hypothetical protein